LGRISPSAARPEPATSITRAFNQRLPEKIRGAGTLYLWLGADFVQGFLLGRPSAEVRA